MIDELIDKMDNVCYPDFCILFTILNLQTY
jgi:hypothetical protein